MMKVSIDIEACTGCGACADMCPDVFIMDDDIAIVGMEDVPTDCETACCAAMDSCPAGAISINEE